MQNLFEKGSKSEILCDQLRKNKDIEKNQEMIEVLKMLKWLKRKDIKVTH